MGKVLRKQVVSRGCSRRIIARAHIIIGWSMVFLSMVQVHFGIRDMAILIGGGDLVRLMYSIWYGGAIVILLVNEMWRCSFPGSTNREVFQGGLQQVADPPSEDAATNIALACSTPHSN